MQTLPKVTVRRGKSEVRDYLSAEKRENRQGVSTSLSPVYGYGNNCCRSRIIEPESASAQIPFILDFLWRAAKPLPLRNLLAERIELVRRWRDPVGPIISGEGLGCVSVQAPGRGGDACVEALPRFR